MTTLIRTLVIALLAAVIAAPGLATAAPPMRHGTPPYRVTPFVPTSTDRPRLASEWRTWKRQHLHGYVTRVQVSCFCRQRPLRTTTVAGHRVTSVTDAGRAGQRRHGFEMDALYRMLRHAYATADRVSVRWSARGVPRSIMIDRDRRAADDELYVTVRVQAAPSARG